MSNILKIKQFPEVEKCKIIQHLKNEIRIIGDEFKTNNIDLLIHVMNFVEMYFTGHKMGRVKENKYNDDDGHKEEIYINNDFMLDEDQNIIISIDNKYIIPIFIPVVDFIIMDVELLIKLMVMSDLICFVNFFFEKIQYTINY